MTLTQKHVFSIQNITFRDLSEIQKKILKLDNYGNSLLVYAFSSIDDKLSFINKKIKTLIKNNTKVEFDNNYNKFISQDNIASLYYELNINYSALNDNNKYKKEMRVIDCLDKKLVETFLKMNLDIAIKECLVKGFNFFDNNLTLAKYSSIKSLFGRYYAINKAIITSHYTYISAISTS